MNGSIERFFETKFGTSIKDEILSRFRILVIVKKSSFCTCGAGECIITVIPKGVAQKDQSDVTPFVSCVQTIEVGLCDGIYFQDELDVVSSPCCFNRPTTKLHKDSATCKTIGIQAKPVYHSWFDLCKQIVNKGMPWDWQKHLYAIQTGGYLHKW
jgi:hypothetical protein